MVDHEAAVRTKFLALRPVMDERLTPAVGRRRSGRAGRRRDRDRRTRDGAVAHDDPRGPRRVARGRERRGRGAGPTRRRWPAADRGDDAGDRRGAGVAGRSGDPRRSGIAAALDLEEHAQARDRVDGPGLRRQPAEGRAVAAASGYSLQATQKTLEGTAHPDRNEQFEFINDRVDAFHGRGAPVISVDTKKKELVGAFTNGGREWQPSGEPVPVRVHDFIDPTLGKVIPYGVYDLAQNTGWVSVGIDHDTPAFAVESIARWWRYMGQEDLSRRPRTAHHRRRRRQQQRALPPLESRAAALRRPHRLGDQRLAFSAGDVEVEQDRAPAVLPHHRELAWASAHRSRNHRAAHRQRPHGERLDGEGEARYADLSPWRQSPERRYGQPAPDPRRVSR